jgi:hypothetical protein
MMVLLQYLDFLCIEDLDLHNLAVKKASLSDTDQRDPKWVWPNLSRRSNEQQDNSKRIEFEIDQIKPS